MTRPRPLFAALIQATEPLEARRMLSRWNLDAILAAGEHQPGCSCGTCAGVAKASAEAILLATQQVERAIQQQPAPEALPAPGKPVLPEAQPGTEAVFPAVGAQPTGALTGRIVYVGGGHGWTINNTGAGNWYTQRGELNEMIEDMGNQDQIAWYAQYLWNAGATVVPLRPLGNQSNEVVLDNDDAGVTFSGAWVNGSSTPYFGGLSDTQRYRTIAGAPAETATATYAPNIPQAGFYPVYTWALDGVNRATDQLYRVNHAGGTTEVKINHQWVGKGWVYLGTYYFNQGAGGSVQISNKSTGTGAIIADAIRFGNGMGTFTNALGQTSGAPREDEAALYWIEGSKGAGVDTFYRGGNSDDGDANVGAPTRWAAYMNAAPFGQAVHLSFHSNAGGGRGTVGLYNDETLFPNTATPNQFQWAKLVGDEVEADMVAIGSPPLEFAWTPRTNPIARTDFAFGEIRTSANGDEFDSTILEVAFHDSAQDAAMLRDPKVRNWVGRSSYQATIKYFNQFGALANTTLLPDAPSAVQATRNSNGDITLRWTAPVAGPAVSGTATGYRVYSSFDGFSFDAGTAVAGGGTLSHTIPAGQLPAGSQALYFRVAATNAGGESLPSAVVGTRAGAIALDKVLVVNGFDRIDRTGASRQLTPNGLTIDRVRIRSGNTLDFVVRAGEAVEAYAPRQVGFDSATPRNIELGQVNLADYRAVIWLSGEQSTANITFSASAQSAVTNYINAGGDVFVSGSELAWDLVNNNSGATFYRNSLRANFSADSAGVYGAGGVAGSIFAGLSLSFDNGNSGTYDVNSADVLLPFNGSTAALTYSGGSNVAAVQHENSVTDAHVVTMAIPFETITSVANRNAVMAAVLGFFSADFTPPTITGNLFEFENNRTLRVNFSEDVSESLTAADVTITNLTTGQVLGGGDFLLTYNTAQNIASIDFPGLLNDGNWRVAFSAAGIVDGAGNALAGLAAVDFFTFAGDANRNRTVDITDFGLLASNFNRFPRDFGQGDFNYDDTVNIDDFSVLATKFNTVLPPVGSRGTDTRAAAPVFATRGFADLERKRVFDDLLAGDTAFPGL